MTNTDTAPPEALEERAQHVLLPLLRNRRLLAVRKAREACCILKDQTLPRQLFNANNTDRQHTAAMAGLLGQHRPPHSKQCHTAQDEAICFPYTPLHESTVDIPGTYIGNNHVPGLLMQHFINPSSNKPSGSWSRFTTAGSC